MLLAAGKLKGPWTYAIRQDSDQPMYLGSYSRVLTLQKKWTPQQALEILFKLCKWSDRALDKRGNLRIIQG